LYGRITPEDESLSDSVTLAGEHPSRKQKTAEDCGFYAAQATLPSQDSASHRSTAEKSAMVREEVLTFRNSAAYKLLHGAPRRHGAMARLRSSSLMFGDKTPRLTSAVLASTALVIL
jgi:hypothetical protein